RFVRLPHPLQISGLSSTRLESSKGKPCLSCLRSSRCFETTDARNHTRHEPGAKRGYTPGRIRGTTWVVHQAYERSRGMSTANMGHTMLYKIKDTSFDFSTASSYRQSNR